MSDLKLLTINRDMRYDMRAEGKKFEASLIV